MTAQAQKVSASMRETQTIPFSVGGSGTPLGASRTRAHTRLRRAAVEGIGGSCRS
jgi:hypothetical protein